MVIAYGGLKEIISHSSSTTAYVRLGIFCILRFKICLLSDAKSQNLFLNDPKDVLLFSYVLRAKTSRLVHVLCFWRIQT